jgi:hypothetical protein
MNFKKSATLITSVVLFLLNWALRIKLDITWATDNSSLLYATLSSGSGREERKKHPRNVAQNEDQLP